MLNDSLDIKNSQQNVITQDLLIGTNMCNHNCADAVMAVYVIKRMPSKVLKM